MRKLVMYDLADSGWQDVVVQKGAIFVGADASKEDAVRSVVAIVRDGEEHETRKVFVAAVGDPIPDEPIRVVGFGIDKFWTPFVVLEPGVVTHRNSTNETRHPVEH